MRRRAALACALILLAIVAHPGTSEADGTGGDGSGHDIDLSQGDGHGGGTGGTGGQSHGPVCVWRDATLDQIDATINNAGIGGQTIRDEADDPGIQVLICDGRYDGHTWRVKPRPLTPQELAQRAYVVLQRDLPHPAVRSTPADGRPSVVHVPVFVWLDAADWTPQRYTETDPNGSGLSITAVAAPTTMAFDPGDGTGPITCAGPATPYDPSAGTDPWAQAGAPDHCTHAYERVTRNVDGSAVAGRPDAWPARVAVRWDVAWTATNGARGTLPPIQKATTLDRPVTEIQTVVMG